MIIVLLSTTSKKKENFNNTDVSRRRDWRKAVFDNKIKTRAKRDVGISDSNTRRRYEVAI